MTGIVVLKSTIKPSLFDNTLYAHILSVQVRNLFDHKDMVIGRDRKGYEESWKKRALRYH